MSDWKVGEIREIVGKKVKLVKTKEEYSCTGCIYDNDLNECIDNGTELICSAYSESRYARDDEGFIFKAATHVIFREVENES